MGLDMSTATGLSIVQNDGELPVVFHTEMVTFKSLTGWERVNAIAGQIMTQHEKFKPDFVVLEGYGFSQSGSIITLAEIGSVVRFLFWQEGITYFDVPPTSLKKFVAGKGNATKDQMVLSVFKRFGYSADTNDIADAIGLGMFGLCAAGLKFTLESQKSVFMVMKEYKGKPLPRIKF